MGDWINTAGIIKDALRTLCFWLCSFIYEAVIIIYNIFDKLCGGRFLDNKILEAFAQRVGVILGLVMAFIVIFTIIKMVLDPDKISDKEMGVTALLRKIIIVVIMLGCSNFVFNALYTVQKTVIESDAITKLLLPIQIDTSTSDDFGSILAVELISAFYYVDPSLENSSEAANCVGTINAFKNQIVDYGNFQLGYQCLNTTVNGTDDSDKQYVVYYNALISVIVGAVVAYFVFVYCIKVGVRMVQLMFLEIIAPLAIVSYALPKKDTMFSKWLKMYISTYIDVFIRIAIINFVAFLIAVLFANEESFIFWGTIGEVTSKEKNWITVIIVIALLTFAKKMPELLGDLIGKGASKLGFGVSSPKQLFDGMLGGSTIRKGLTTGAKMATVGTAIGLTSSLLSGASRYRMNMKDVDKNDPDAVRKARKNAILGAAGGAFMAYGRGLKAGATSKGNVFSSIGKGISAQRGIDDKYDQLITSGGTPMGAFKAKMASYVGETVAQEGNRRIKNMQDLMGYYDGMKKQAAEFSFVKAAQEAATFAQWDKENETEEEFRARKSALEKHVRTLRKQAEQAASLGLDSFELKDADGNFILDENGNKLSYNFSDSDDKARSIRIKTYADEADAYAKTHRVKRYDTKNKKWVDVAPISDADTLRNMETYAIETESHIKTDPKYRESVANDAHAGIGNSTKK